MCVIIVKEKGIDAPVKDILKRCFIQNGHGAGIAVRRNGTNKWFISKGYLTDKSAINAFNSFKVKADDLAIYHFRTGTSGKIDSSNCHPFPVTDNVKELQACSISCEMVIAHNGIIGAGEKELSDTMIFIRDILSTPIVKDSIFSNGAIQELISGYIGGDRLAIGNGKDKILLLGEFIHDKKSGLIFSCDIYGKTTNSIIYDLEHWRSWEREYDYTGAYPVIHGYNGKHDVITDDLINDGDECPHCGETTVHIGKNRYCYVCGDTF